MPQSAPSDAEESQADVGAISKNSVIVPCEPASPATSASSMSSAQMEAHVTTRAVGAKLSLTGPLAVGGFAAISAVSLLYRGDPVHNSSHFVLALLSLAVLGGMLSLLLMNLRIEDFKKLLEEKRVEGERYRAEIESLAEALSAERERGEARCRRLEGLLKRSLGHAPEK